MLKTFKQLWKENQTGSPYVHPGKIGLSKLLQYTILPPSKFKDWDKLYKYFLNISAESVYKGNISRDEIINIINNEWYKLSILNKEVIEIIKLLLKAANPNEILIIGSDYGYLINQLIDWKSVINLSNESYRLDFEIVNYLYPEIKIIEEEKINLDDLNPLDNIKKFDFVISNVLGNSTIGKSRVKINGYLIIIDRLSVLNESTWRQNFRDEIIRNYSLEMIIEFREFAFILIRFHDIKRDVLVIDGQNHQPKDIFNFYQEQVSDFHIKRESMGFRWDIHFLRSEPELTYLYNKENNYTDLLRISNEILEGIDPQEMIASKFISRVSGYKMINANFTINQQQMELMKSKEGNMENTSYFLDEKVFEEIFEYKKYILQPGDLIINLYGPTFQTYIYKKDDPNSVVINRCAIIRSPYNNKLRTFFKSDIGQKILCKYSTPNWNKAHDSELELNIMALKLIPVPDYSDVRIQNKWNVNDNIFGDIKSLFKEELDPLIENQNTIINKIDRHTNLLEKIDENVDRLINKIEEGFSNIKSSSDSVEGKLLKLYDFVDSKLNENEIDYSNFEENIIETLNIQQWNKLHELSKLFLPSAQFLRFHIEQYNGVDWSPVLIQLCRALENEIAQKIFNKYISNLAENKLLIADPNKEPNKETGLKGVIAIEFKQKFISDFELKVNGKIKNESGNRFAVSILEGVKYDPSNDKYIWEIELGRMGISLEMLTGKQVNQSPILIDFANFIKRNFNENILLKEYVTQIRRIAKNYRNKAAHPHHITIDIAKQGWDEIIDILKKFMEFYNGQL